MNPITTIKLARYMAKKYNEDEDQAITHCAKNIWFEIKNPKLQSIVYDLSLKTTSFQEKIKLLDKL